MIRADETMTDDDRRIVRVVPSGPVMVQGPVRMRCPTAAWWNPIDSWWRSARVGAARHIPCATPAIGADGAADASGQSSGQRRAVLRPALHGVGREAISTTSRALIPNTTSRSSCGSLRPGRRPHRSAPPARVRHRPRHARGRTPRTVRARPPLKRLHRPSRTR